jgi:hypothetical protein
LKTAHYRVKNSYIDSRAIVGRIFDCLAERYGNDQIFLDIDAIPYGTNFRDHIDTILEQCKVLIVVVGTHWRAQRADGPPRIFDDDDPMRMEVQTASAHCIRIIPVLVDEMIMPQPNDLPEPLRAFSLLRIASGLDFKVHVGRLIIALEQIVGMPATAGSEGASARQLPAALSAGDPNGQALRFIGAGRSVVAQNRLRWTTRSAGHPRNALSVATHRLPMRRFPP